MPLGPLRDAFARRVPEMSRFAIVGCANTLIDFCVFWTLTQAAHLPLVLANLAAWAVAFTFSVLVNGRWTFGLPLGRILRLGYYARLAAASLLTVAVTTTILVLSAPHLSLAVAKILSIGVGFALNYGFAKRAAAAHGALGDKT